MIDNSTLETLKAMRCSAMAQEFEKQLEDSKTYDTLSFEERVGLLVDAEWNRRQKNNALISRIRSASGFSIC